MRILWGSPLPPTRSGVSDYAVELLAELGLRAKVRVLRPPGWSRPDDWPLEERVELVSRETEPLPDELSLIHLGNNPHHLWLLDRLARPRTVVVLHDLVLHHLLVEATAGAGNERQLEEMLIAAHGGRGEALARARRFGQSGSRDPFLFPARACFLKSAAGVVVHSRWAKNSLVEEMPGLPIAHLGLPAIDPGPVDRKAVRERLGLTEDDVVLMHLGFMTPEKGLSEILAGVAAAIRTGVPVRLMLVGEGGSSDAVAAAAEKIGIGDRVNTAGWLPTNDFLCAPSAADLGVVLRTPSAGETSAAAIRFLACGTPVAVGGLRQFLEWPEAAAPRITPGPSSAADLARLLSEAAAMGKDWTIRREAARASYESDHRPGDTAEKMIEFLGVVSAREDVLPTTRE
jgi:glycosyltransferase involved in cell wall biosynthesis